MLNMKKKILNESEETFLRNVGHRIAEVRIKRGLSQAQVAEKNNTHSHQVQECETLRNMTLLTIFRFKEILGCPAWEFFLEPKTSRHGPGRPRKRLLNQKR